MCAAWPLHFWEPSEWSLHWERFVRGIGWWAVVLSGLSFIWCSAVQSGLWLALLPSLPAFGCRLGFRLRPCVRRFLCLPFGICLALAALSLESLAWPAARTPVAPALPFAFFAPVAPAFPLAFLPCVCLPALGFCCAFRCGRHALGLLHIIRLSGCDAVAWHRFPPLLGLHCGRGVGSSTGLGRSCGPLALQNPGGWWQKSGICEAMQVQEP